MTACIPSTGLLARAKRLDDAYLAQRAAGTSVLALLRPVAAGACAAAAASGALVLWSVSLAGVLVTYVFLPSALLATAAAVLRPRKADGAGQGA